MTDANAVLHAATDAVLTRDGESFPIVVSMTWWSHDPLAVHLGVKVKQSSNTTWVLSRELMDDAVVSPGIRFGAHDIRTVVEDACFRIVLYPEDDKETALDLPLGTTYDFIQAMERSVPLMASCEWVAAELTRQVGTFLTIRH